MVTTEATWSRGCGDPACTETNGLIKLGIIDRGRELLRSLVEDKRCLSPRDDVERVLEDERSSLDRISTADKRDVYAQLLEYAFSQYHGDGWRHRMGPPL